MTDTNDVVVTDNHTDSRLEVHADGELGELVYRKNGNRLVLVHTEVPRALGGRGIAGKLVLAALDKAVAGGMTVVPLCPYARSWLERHPDEAARVPVDWSRP
ncbi:MAG TPA: GNAT family N-acetyltransferase [Streptosporangiaceae bacterium]|jgi:predicted GNAT family acetyltransferase|nr:GNAT family N-acetyltransferase [Streptosporangiaceae bacterium]